MVEVMLSIHLLPSFVSCISHLGHGYMPAAAIANMALPLDHQL